MRLGPEAFAGLVTAPVFKIGEAFETNAWWVRFPSASAENQPLEISSRLASLVVSLGGNECCWFEIGSHFL